MILSEMSIVELKALAYDEVAKSEQAQKNLSVINQTIVAKLKEAENDKQTTVEPAGDFRASEGKTETGTGSVTEDDKDATE